MKISVTIDSQGQRESLCLQWRLPDAEHPSSLYLLPGELTPTQYPHAVNDLSHVAVFYGDHFTLFFAPDGSCSGRDAAGTARAEVIHCDTFKLLEVLRHLYAKRVPQTVLNTDRFRRDHSVPLLTVGQLAAHPNLQDRQRLGKTLQHFWHILARGSERTFADLMRDLSHYVQCARLYANGDEFYFDGRIPNGCGFNGGIVPHLNQNSYGIHT